MILRSSDDVSFKVYRKDLEAYSDGFVGPPSSIDEVEVVQLTETSRVLELLLQFMRRQRQPSFKDVDFNVLDGLAEAAEKYEVFRATEPCKIWMSAAASSHPVEVLSYAMKHDYTELANQCAVHTIGLDVDSTLKRLPPNAQLPWLRYCYKWHNVVPDLLRYKNPIQCRRKSPPDGPPCALWSEFYARVAEKFARGGLKVLQPGEIGSVFRIAEETTGIEDCPKCVLRTRFKMAGSRRAVGPAAKIHQIHHFVVA